MSQRAIIDLYKRDIDRTLIRESLKLTVTERFERLMALQRFAEEMQRAGRAARAKGARPADPSKSQ
jgi:hypothetical protein